VCVCVCGVTVLVVADACCWLLNVRRVVVVVVVGGGMTVHACRRACERLVACRHCTTPGVCLPARLYLCE